MAPPKLSPTYSLLSSTISFKVQSTYYLLSATITFKVQSRLSKSIYAFRFDVSVISKYDARVYSVGLYWVSSSFFDHYIKLVKS